MTIYAPVELEKVVIESRRKNTQLDNPLHDISNSRSRFENNAIEKYQIFKQKVKDFKDGAVEFTVGAKDAVIDFFQDTKAEIVVGAAVGVVVGGLWSYSHESAKNKCLKLSFSEDTEQTSHMTGFLKNSNDFYMNIFEAHNESWLDPKVKNNTKSFGDALSKKTKVNEDSFHKVLPKLGNTAIMYGDSVLDDTRYLRSLQSRIDPAITALNNTWEDYHHDSYHTEIYYTTSTDSKGHTTTTMHTRSVYDYTDNSYTYFKKYGDQSHALLNDIKKDFPSIKTDGLFDFATSVSDENKKIIEKSRKSELKDTTLTDAQFLEIANNCIKGSRQYSDFTNMEALRIRLAHDGDVWRTQRNTAKSYSERTFNRSHAESAEFITCEDAIYTGSGLQKLIDESLGSIISTKERIPRIKEMITHYEDIYASLDNLKEAKKLKKKIISESKDGYYALFSQGSQLEPAKWLNVLAFTLIGGALLGGVGAGVDYLGDNTNLYHGSDEDKYTKRRRREERRYHGYSY